MHSIFVIQYQYCGPGTKLDKRLKRQDPGINGLDRACKQHDIAYAKNSSQTERNEADNILAKQAWNRFKSSDASFGERATALGVAGVMKLKSKLGMGLKKRQTKTHRRTKKRPTKTAGKKNRTTVKQRYQTSRKRKQTSKKETKQRKQKKKVVAAPRKVKKIFREAVQSAKKSIAFQKPRTIGEATKLAMIAATKAVKLEKRLPKQQVINALPRIIPIPKIGGALPLIPIFAGLSALGALVGGSSSVANTIIAANSAKQKFREAQRHNETMEAIALGRSAKGGNGLYLSPHKKGLGLFVRPYDHSKN